MRTVELIEEAVALARSAGYQIRQEWLEGSGGACEIAGRRWLFLDLSLSRSEQLEQLVEALQQHPTIAGAGVSPPLRKLLGLRTSSKAA